MESGVGAETRPGAKAWALRDLESPLLRDEESTKESGQRPQSCRR